jgi:hypothetical protein
MYPTKDLKFSADPIENFYGSINWGWEKISSAYDVSTEMPDAKYLFNNIALNDPNRAAQEVLANMLIEISEQVHRFSPWYKLPARSFGLVSHRDPKSHQITWGLAPEAAQKWCQIINLIAREISSKKGLVEAIILIDDLELEPNYDNHTVLAVCNCNPPRELLIQYKFLIEAGIICNACCHPFLPVED